MFLDDIHQAFCQINTRNLWTYLFAVFWKNYLAHWLICCFGILLPSYSISGCCTIPPCCTGRRRWPQKLLHLPSWMTPRWLHTIRKAGDVKNGWHKYNYVIHTGCMVKKNRSKTPTFWKIITWCFVKSNLQEPLRSSEATGTCRFWLPNWWFWNRLRHTWPMAAIAVALYKDIYIYIDMGGSPKIGGYILQNGWVFCFFLWKTPLKMEDLGGTPIFGNTQIEM